ncbi:cell wall hydrolase [Lachnospiraceae bacterium LCP25S3_G4]
MKKQVKHLLHRTFGMTFAICLFLSNIQVYATESVDSLESTTSNLETELSNLNNELDALCAKLDATLAQIESTTEEVANAKVALTLAKEDEEQQYIDMKLRIKYIYESGNASFLELLFNADNMTDFLNKADFISNISDYDREMLENLHATQEEIARKEASLEEENATLSGLKDDLAKEQQALESKVSSTSSDLANYSDRLSRAKSALASANAQLGNQTTIAGNEPPSTGNTGPSEDEEAPAPPPPPSVPATTQDVDLLAAIIECEAGGGSYDGMVAVGGVIMNRVRSSRFPNTIYDVIYQKGQFSPASSGKLARVLERGANATCYNAANDALNGINPAGNCLYFNYVGSGHAGTVIGANVFW